MPSKEANARWRAKNKEHLSAYMAQYWSDNRDKLRAANKARYEKRREEQLAFNKQKRKEHLEFTNKIKEGKSCAECKQIYPPYIMEFDHIFGKKDFKISSMATCSRDIVIKEIEKCVIVCCACHRVRTQSRKTPYQTPKMVRFRLWLDELKSKPCLDCGNVRPLVAMDFDHVRGEKVANISQMWSWRRARVEAEIAKCDLVCANCHRERTHRREHSVDVPTELITKYIHTYDKVLFEFNEANHREEVIDTVLEHYAPWQVQELLNEAAKISLELAFDLCRTLLMRTLAHW